MNQPAALELAQQTTGRLRTIMKDQQLVTSLSRSLCLSLSLCQNPLVADPHFQLHHSAMSDATCYAVLSRCYVCVGVEADGARADATRGGAV